MRASVCVFLVVLVRLLNLAVPMLYKRVVDELSWVSSETAQGRTFPFTKVCLPACLPQSILFKIYRTLDHPVQAGGG